MWWWSRAAGVANVANVVQPELPCGEQELRRRGANITEVVDPLSWQFNMTGGVDRDRLTALDAARRVAILGKKRAAIPCGNHRVPICEGVQRGGVQHVRFAQTLGLEQPVFFYRHSTDCTALARPTCSPHDAVFGGSLGNQLGIYWLSRAAAAAGNMDFVWLRDLHACDEEIWQWLPTVVARRGNASDVAKAFAAAEAAICHGVNSFIHLSDVWVPATPAVSLELRAIMEVWAQRASFPPAAAPIDDVAIHVRCGDTLAQAHGQYGLLAFDTLAQFVPLGRASSVGIVTQPYARFCDDHKFDARSPTHSADQCSCPCALLVKSLTLALKAMRPLATITVHDDDTMMGAWARLALAPHATVCNPSTFCLWPTLAANRGYLAAASLFPQARKIADLVPNVGVVTSPTYKSYHDLATSKVKNGCGTSVAQMQTKITRLLRPKNQRANSTQPNVQVRGLAMPPRT